MLGHAKASMTLDVYTDLFDVDLDDVAVDLDAAISAAEAPGKDASQSLLPAAFRSAAWPPLVSSAGSPAG
jgi:hypothetical protein